MTPDARRRLAGALMTEQFNRPTPQDTEVVKRGGLLPVGTYANGMTGPAIPGFIYDGLFGPGDAASGKLGNYQDNREEWAKVGFDTAGAAMVGGLAAPRPRGSIGMSGRPEGAAANAAAERPGSQLANRSNATLIDNIGLNDPHPGPVLAFRGSGAPDWTGQFRIRPDGEFAPFLGTSEAAGEYAKFNRSSTSTTRETANQKVVPALINSKKTFDLAGDRNFYIAAKDLRDAMENAGIATGGVFSKLSERRQIEELRDLLLMEGYDAIRRKHVSNGFTYGESVDTKPVWEYIPIKKGITTSPLSGETLFANGGRPGAAVGAAANSLAERPGIRAYHGSPHDFDKFDMSKIGTGEGAQAYGHGLYFAENEGVAQSYRQGLSRADGGIDQIAQTLVDQAGGDWKKAAQKFESDALERVRRLRDAGLNYELPPHDVATLQALRKGEPGRLYEVRINANPDDFLDWDKPLSQQSEKVRAAANKAWGGGLDPNAPGIRYAPTSPEMTEKFKNLGVAGTKYLDQGSRSQGEGSRNYVVFDDSLVEILRKYGLLGMAGGAAANEIMNNPNKAIAQQLMQDDANKYRGAI